MNRWFDLSSNGAKLDRLINEKGLAFLQLTFGETFDAANGSDAINRAGWVKGPEGKSLQNFGSYRDLSEIATILQPMFGEDAVSASIVARNQLRQGEVLQGVDRPVHVDFGFIETGIRQMAAMAQDRVMDNVRSARERIAKKKLNSLGPTGGNFAKMVAGVSENSGERRSRIVAKLLPVRYDDTSMGIVQTALDRGEKGKDVSLTELLASLNGHDKLFAELEDRLGNIYGDMPQLEDVLIAEFMSKKGVGASTVIDYDTVRSELGEDLTVGVKDNVRGYKFEISPDTTTLVGREINARLEQTLDYLADTFGMDVSDLFTEKTRFRVVQKAGLSDLGERGGYSATTKAIDAVGDVEFQAGAIVFRPDNISVALHEIGHGFDANLGDDEAKYETILGDTGLRELYGGTVGGAQIAEGFGAEIKQYLMSDEEMFARYFENAIRQHCIDQTGSIDAIGGLVIAGHRPSYAPMDKETLSVFVEAVKEYSQSIGHTLSEETKIDRDKKPQPVSTTMSI